MLSNFHTHTTFCDGKNSPEEIVLCAIEEGFCSLGFSGHSYTPFDKRYCITDIQGYINEIKRLKEKYKDKIEILLGVEEDMWGKVDREKYDYIIGSCHYLRVQDKYYPLDDSYDALKKCVDAIATGENATLSLAEKYYSSFCDYILTRKPDIVGHFDLITKYDEANPPLFLGNPQYHKIAEHYIDVASKSGCVFEVNTGAISRGYRTTPYPYENLLYILKKNGNRVILSSDSHKAQTLSSHFDDAKQILRDIGFENMVTLTKDGFKNVPLK